MKISAVPTSSTHSNNNNESHANTANKNHKFHKKQSPGHKPKRPGGNDSSSSCCSECSDSGSDSSNSATNNHSTKRSNKSSNVRHTTTSSDSDSSDEADSDDESRFPKNKPGTRNDDSKPSNKINQTVDAADGASSSDMELPALVNAAIQRVESFSDGENSKTDPIPQYTSTLLRDFMVKTQMMGATFTAASIDKKESRQFDGIGASGGRWQQQHGSNKDIKTESPLLLLPSDAVPQKRKRGRPKKQMPLVVNVGLSATSESPDSGIISTPHSPVLPVLTTSDNGRKTPHNQRKKSESSSNTSMPKLNIASLEKSIYATERVLYPPRRKKQRDASTKPPPQTLSEDLLDPVWRKIDINKKFRRPSVSGYKSDGGCSTVCSKVLVARCNNVSGDYGSVSQRSLSGYKSDYSCKSKRSGYKSDYSVKAKSCGYRTDSGMKNRKRVRKKRRLKSLCSKSPVNDLDILQLAGLSLGQSEESSRDSLHHRSTGNLLSKSNFRKKSKSSGDRNTTTANTSKDILSSLCERVTKRLSGIDETPPPTPPFSSHKLGSSSLKSGASGKPGMITCRRMSTVSHCSSRSGGSRMHSRRKHRKRFKSRCRSENGDTNSSKLAMQIEMLTSSFTTLCHIYDKTTRADASKSKRVVKKRKQSVNSDAANASATTTKRRHKKVPQTQSPDDHKLPLKKRLYLLTEKLDGKQSSGDNESMPSTSRSTTKAITPKKRHLLLENQLPNVSASSPKSLNSPKHMDFSSIDSTAPVPTNPPQQKTHHQRKRSKTESTSAKHQLSTDATVSSKINNIATRPSVIRPSSTSLPPPGVFESTIDLEVQIPTLPHIITKTEIDSPRTFGESLTKIVKDEPNAKTERLVESLLNKTGGHLLLRKKRKKANRTGFPTVRKKKKKLDDWSAVAAEVKPSTTIPVEATSDIADTNETTLPTNHDSVVDDCDRVPKSGETADTFIERNSRPRLSVVSLERLQGKVSAEEDITPADAIVDTKLVDDSNEDSTLVVKRRRSEVIGRVKQHLKKNIREPRDLSSDNEPLINLISAKTKSTTKTKPPLPSKPTPEMHSSSKRSRRVISLDKLGEDQIKEIERTSKLAIVKLEVLKGDKASVSGTRSRPSRSLPEKAKSLEKPKKTKILTARETLLSEETVEVGVVKMTRRLTRDMSTSGLPESAKRTRQNVGTLKESCKSKGSDKPKSHASKSRATDGKRVTDDSTEVNPNKSLKVADPVDDKNSSKVIADNQHKSKKSHRPVGDKVSASSESKSSTTKAEADQTNPSDSWSDNTESLKKKSKSKDKSTTKPATNKKPPTTKPPNDCKNFQPNETNASPANFDLEELLVGATTTISKTFGTTDAKDKTKSSKASSASKKLTPIEPRRSIDSKSNYQSEFEKSLTDVMSKKKVLSKENVDRPASPVKASKNFQSTGSNDVTKAAAKPTKGRKRKLSIPLPSDDKDSASGEPIKQPKILPSDSKVEANRQTANVSRKSGIKKRGAKVTDKPLIELQPQIVDSSNLSSSDAIQKTDTLEPPVASKTLRKVTKQPSPVDLPDKDTSEHSDDDFDDVRPFDPLLDLEHDPLPPEQGLKMPEPLSDSDSSKKVAKPKKKYLTAGLFSDYYKRTPTASDKSRVKETIPDDHRVTLPIPPYCEKYFRRTIQDFELPYDLWFAHQNEKLPGRNSVPSWNFKKLRTNIYGDVRANPSSDQQPCSCKPETACGDDCLNRLMYTECSPKTCPCADKCQNTKIQRHIVAPGVERFMTENKGWGVKTKQPLKKSTYILEYVGEVVTEREFKERMATLYTRDTHHYCLNLDGGLVIDGHRSGSDARFVNHSCSPNCEIQKWSVNGLFRMALFAMRDIEPGEELTYDYNFSLFNPAEGQPCRCDSAQCRGVIGGKSQRIKPIEAQVSRWFFFISLATSFP